MAVDTRFKRFAMMTFGVPESVAVLFEADGSVDADDRANLLGLYGGIALDAPVVSTVAILAMNTYRQQRIA